KGYAGHIFKASRLIGILPASVDRGVLPYDILAEIPRLRAADVLIPAGEGEAFAFRRALRLRNRAAVRHCYAPGHIARAAVQVKGDRMGLVVFLRRYRDGVDVVILGIAPAAEADVARAGAP